MVRRFTRRNFLSLAALGAAAPIFDVKPLRGIDFILQNSPTPRKFLIETMPGGVALFDYNNDGLLDIFRVNGGKITEPLRVPENSIAAILATGTGYTARIPTGALRTSHAPQVWLTRETVTMG